MLLEINELTTEEELALIGLLKAVIQADKQLSFDENQELGRIAQMMGVPRFNERVAEARKLFRTLSDIKKYAQQIERPPARQLIFNLVHEMAKQDEVIPAEEELLGWLAELWGVEFFRK